jgi:hypothetical protein
MGVGMGTSKAVAGPRGGRWVGAGRRLGGWERQLATDDGSGGAQSGVAAAGARAPEVGEAYRRALADTLATSPSEFGLRAALIAAGERLLDAFDRLAAEGAAAFGQLDGADVDERLDLFAAHLADAVVGPGGGLVDAAIRRAVAGPVVDALAIPDTPLGQAVRDGGSGGVPIIGELLCSVYQLFFAKSVSGFLNTVIAEKIKLAVPVLYAVDPAGIVANWISGQIVSLLPSPCEEQQNHSPDGGSLTEVARGLLHETVDRALGLPTAQQAAA